MLDIAYATYVVEPVDWDASQHNTEIASFKKVKLSTLSCSQSKVAETFKISYSAYTE